MTRSPSPLTEKVHEEDLESRVGDTQYGQPSATASAAGRPIPASKTYERIDDDSPTLERVDPQGVAAALGAEPPHPPPHEQWATCARPDKFSAGKYRLCLWGDKGSAVENCDPDERVCRVRVEVLEML